MKGHDDAVARLAWIRDDALSAVATGPAAQDLLADIVASTLPVPQAERKPTRRRLVAGLAIAAAVTAVVVAAPGLLGYRPGGATTYANSAIEVHREGDSLVARIKDPLADGATFAEAYRAFGKDVRVSFVPVPPRLVGQLLRSGGGSGPVSSEVVPIGAEPVNCGLEPDACTLVIRISTDTGGTVSYTFGRPAQPGETYQPPWGN